MTNSVTAVFNDMGANSFQLFLSDKPDENGALNYNRSYEAEDYLNDDIQMCIRDSMNPQKVVDSPHQKNILTILPMPGSMFLYLRITTAQAIVMTSK